MGTTQANVTLLVLAAENALLYTQLPKKLKKSQRFDSRCICTPGSVWVYTLYEHEKLNDKSPSRMHTHTQTHSNPCPEKLYIELFRVLKTTVVVKDNSTGVKVHTDCTLIKVPTSHLYIRMFRTTLQSLRPYGWQQVGWVHHCWSQDFLGAGELCEHIFERQYQ